MNRDDIQKLLGGYATGTLSDAERQALFQAALENQSLFDALADESALKELLDDPDARAYLLEALPAKPKAVVKPRPAWSWAAAGSIAAVVVVGVFLLRGPEPQKPVPQLVAMARQPELDAAAPARVEPAAPAEKQKATSDKESKELYSALKDARVSASTSVPQAKPVASPLAQSANALREKDEKTDAKLAAVEHREMAPAPAAISGFAPPLPPRSAPQAAGQRAGIDAARTRPPLAVSGALDRPAEGKVASADSVSAAASQQKIAPQQEAEAVVVTGGASSAGAINLSNATGVQLNARQLFYGAAPGADLGFAAGRADIVRTAKRAAATATVVGIRYAVLRRGPDGSFVEVDPTTIFQAGDSLRLSVETNAAGYLAVWDADTALANLRVIARTQYTIPPDGAIRLSAPSGEKNLLLVFSSQPERKPASLATGLLVEQSPENAVYVAGARLAVPVSFSITLTYR